MLGKQRRPGTRSKFVAEPRAAASTDHEQTAQSHTNSSSGTRRWVSLARACDVLGVNESTVRRWADAGQIPCFRTPGGHRRFSEQALFKLVASGGHQPQRELETAAVSRIRRQLSSNRSDAGWYEAMEGDEREALRPLGRRLVELVDDYITHRAPHAKVEREVDAIGERYGTILFECDTPLSQAIQAFTFFRRSLDETAKRLAKRRRMSQQEAGRAREQIAELADRVLLGLSTAYDEGQALVSMTKPTSSSTRTARRRGRS